jgi:ubiquinone/menaquinone biosynthesis C-methylase UbiE
MSGPPPIDWGVGHYESTAAQLEPAAQVVVARAEILPGERVLDLGCGTGNAALAAARAGGEVIGVDPAARLLDVARSRAAAEGLSVNFEAGDASSIPLPDGSVDAVVSVFAVIFAPDPKASAAEMSRVLTSTGRIVVSSWQPRGAIYEMNKVASETMMRALGAPPPSQAGFAWHERDSLVEVFAPHGFDVTLDEHVLAYRAASAEEYVDTEQQNHPMAVSGAAVLEMMGKADDELRDQLRARMVEILAAANEAPEGFSVSSPYVVATMQRVAS